MTDVLLYDSIGGPFSLSTTQRKGTGGSELAIVQIGHALAKKGYRVVIANDRNDVTMEEGVRYVPIDDLGVGDRVRSMVLSRCSPAPEGLAADRIVVLAQDVNHRAYDVHLPILAKGDGILVCISHWQASLFPFAKQRRVITPILDPIPVVSKEPNLFVYASAAQKGLAPTLYMWRLLKSKYESALKDAALMVTTPGYDEPDFEDIEQTPGCEWAGSALAPPKARELIARAAGLFYVNAMPETFCAVVAVAEAAKTRTHVLCLKGKGALGEALINTRLVTTSQDQFEIDFMEAWRDPGDPKWYVDKVIDRSSDRLVGEWEDTLGLSTVHH